MATNPKILTVGQDCSDLDIFISAGQNGQPIDPSGITFRIFDADNTLAVNTTSGNRVDIGFYNASGAIIPGGFTLGDWTIKWDVVLPGGASGQFLEDFCVELPNLFASINAPNSNVSSIYDRVRIDIGDPNATIFNDAFLRRVLEKAIARLNRRLGVVRVSNQTSIYCFCLCFEGSSLPQISVNLLTGELTPNNHNYIDLVVLQMEHIIITGESIAFQRLNAQLGGVFGSGIIGSEREGVTVTNADNVSISVSSSRLTTRAQMIRFNVERIENELDEAVRDFRWRLSGSKGKDVTIPRYPYGGYYGGYWRGGC